jgi:hypothetical protein
VLRFAGIKWTSVSLAVKAFNWLNYIFWKNIRDPCAKRSILGSYSSNSSLLLLPFGSLVLPECQYLQPIPLSVSEGVVTKTEDIAVKRLAPRRSQYPTEGFKGLLLAKEALVMVRGIPFVLTEKQVAAFQTNSTSQQFHKIDETQI